MNPIPVTVIGGYLGAGKTTLLNALLRNQSGTRFAVLVNDFGSINVDAEAIASTGADTVELTNGCTCCTIGGDLVLALKAVLARTRPPDAIVIEASGVADPAAVARLAACHPALASQATIVVADAETVRARADDKYVGGLVRRQLQSADAIVLAKVDLVSARALAELRAWFEATDAGAPIFESTGGESIPVGIVADGSLAAGLRDGTVAAEGNGHAATFVTAAYRCAAPLDRARFLKAIPAMTHALVRAKGTLSFAGDAQRYRFQLAGERWSIEPLAAAGVDRETRIVAIALAQREGALQETLAALRRSEI
jgi:G3E family GTPase